MNLDKSNQLKERLGPGVWVDGNDHLHFSIPELLAFFKWPDTPENRARVTAMVLQVGKTNNPQIKVIERNHENQNN